MKRKRLARALVAQSVTLSKLGKKVRKLEAHNEALSNAIRRIMGEIEIDGVRHLYECDMHLFGRQYACTCGSEPERVKVAPYAKGQGR